MRLLVSVATAADARAAVAGGADIIDAKDPSEGALGAVSLHRLCEIRDAVAGARPLTAALGDAVDEAVTERLAREYADAGATLVKIGLLGTPCADRATRLVSAAVLGLSTTSSGVVVVAYADADTDTTLGPNDAIHVAARGGARGVLIDTINKNGPGLLGVMSPGDLSQWVAAGHAAGLLVAAAGKLSAGDLRVIDDVGADVAGVRGAAAVGGRGGRVSVDLVRRLAGYTARMIARSDAATGDAAAPPGYRSQSSDTSYDVDRLLIDLWATMSPPEKAHRVASAFRGVEQLCEAGVRLRHPAAAESEVRLRVAALRLGRRLMIDAYGWDPGPDSA